MNVRAKMKVMTVTKGGDAKKPYVQVKLGAVYSNDPESENRSFATATPSGEVSLNIDAGRPAADQFGVGEEWYVDLTKVGVPERMFLGDYVNPPCEGDYLLESRDGSRMLTAHYANGWFLSGERVDLYASESRARHGVDFWRHPKDDEMRGAA
jgi:hypothetical protein